MSSPQAARSCRTETSGQVEPALTPSLQLPADPELARLVDAWPTLPAHIRAAVLALVQTAGQ